MHELSVALRIVEALDQELAGEGEDLLVTAVTIQIGTLTALVPEALQFSWDLATENTLLQGSMLNIQSMRCPVCRTPITQITGGNDLEILTVEVADTTHA
jgi:hydrogenase nickel incorporation protein HypA/HybF